LNAPGNGLLLHPHDTFEVVSEMAGPLGSLFLELANDMGWIIDQCPVVGTLCTRSAAVPRKASESPQRVPDHLEYQTVANLSLHDNAAKRSGIRSMLPAFRRTCPSDTGSKDATNTVADIEPCGGSKVVAVEKTEVAPTASVYRPASAPDARRTKDAPGAVCTQSPDPVAQTTAAKSRPASAKNVSWEEKVASDAKRQAPTPQAWGEQDVQPERPKSALKRTNPNEDKQDPVDGFCDSMASPNNAEPQEEEEDAPQSDSDHEVGPPNAGQEKSDGSKIKPPCGDDDDRPALLELEPQPVERSALERIRVRLRAIVEGNVFEASFAAFILANSFVMAAERQYHGFDNGQLLAYRGMTLSSEEAWPGAKETFEVIEWFFGILFTFELVMKIAALGLDFTKDAWNWFDTIVVAFWFVSSVGNVSVPLDPMLLRLTRLGRLLRMVRLAKTVKEFDALYIITTSIKGSISALGWGSILLFLLLVMLALLMNQLLEGFILDETKPAKSRMKAFMYYGTFSRALFTTFEQTLGNWVPVGRMLTEEVNEWWIIMVLGYQVSVGFAVVKVIMGVFLQVTFHVASTDKIIMMNQSERAINNHKRKMTLLVAAADEDGTGTIDREEFRQIFDDPIVRQWLASMGLNVSLSVNNADTLFSLVDDGDGELSVEELIRGVSRLKGPARSIDLEVLIRTTQVVRDMVKAVSEGLGTDSRDSEQFGKRLSILKKSTSFDRMEHLGIQKPQSNSNLAIIDEASSEVGDDEAGDTLDATGSQLEKATPTTSLKKDRMSVGERILKARAGAAGGSFEDQRFWLLERLEMVVKSIAFELVFAALIFINTIVMASESQYNGIGVGFEVGYPGYTLPKERAWPGAGATFIAIDWFFGIAFSIEIVVKFIALPREFIKDWWNWLDTIIVLFWALAPSGLLYLPLDPMLLRLFRLVKLLRMLRLIGNLRGLDSLYLMTTSIKASFQALAWSMVLLFLITMMLALVLNQTLDGYLVDDDKPVEQRRTIYKYFGTFSKAMLTMFELTLANWIPASRALHENVSEGLLFLILAHKLIMGFAVVMVITSIFLRETFNVAETDDTIMRNKTRNEMARHFARMSAIFTEFDADGSGALDIEEFKGIATNPDVVSWLQAMGLSVKDVDQMFMLLDDGDGSLTAEELVNGVARLKGPARSADLIQLLSQSKTLEAEVEAIRQKLPNYRG
jgi:Ca2+-binding EF-hand superfamily protein